MPVYLTGAPNISFKKGENTRPVRSENTLNITFYENVNKSLLFYLEDLKLRVPPKEIMQTPLTNKGQLGHILEAKNHHPAVTFAVNTKPCLIRFFALSQNHWVPRAIGSLIKVTCWKY